MSADSSTIVEPRGAGMSTESPPSSGQHALGSVHTSSFPELLGELGVSLLATTYQAGHLIMLRAAGGTLNTHFRSFDRPMGLAVAGDRLAIGTARQIHFFQNVPAVAVKLSGETLPDACYVPRMTHFTGDIQIHEMSFGGDELWFVNTAFSAVCSRGDWCSFVPRWRPRFVSQLAPEDRCHLNGLALIDGQPRYATALGASDTAGGWRAGKRGGGVLIDIASDEIMVRGLSMPHSPRWHNGRLWLLNSGSGGLGTIDLASGQYQEVVRLPGFTRGLTFCGPWAFVGLSQVRESAVFSGIELAETCPARACGVWAIDTRSGQIAGFVQFSGDVQEIFAVELLSGVRMPELLPGTDALVDTSYVLPQADLADVPAVLRQPQGANRPSESP